MGRPASVALAVLLLAATSAAQTQVLPGPAPSLAGSSGLLGVIRASNFNSTSDQAIPMPSGQRYVLRRIVATNASTSLTTAVGGLYTGTAKSGTILVAATQAYAALTASAKYVDLTLASGAMTDTFNAATIYLSLTTAQGAAATADIYVYGDLLP